MTPLQLEELIDALDQDGDGEIDFGLVHVDLPLCAANLFFLFTGFYIFAFNKGFPLLRLI